MSEELRLAIALICGLIILSIGYIKLFLKGRSRKQRFIENAKAKGNYTTGKLIDSKLRLGNDESRNESFRYDRMKVTYEYFVNGVSYKKKMVFQSPGMVAVNYPYTVTVYYNPKNPAKGICKEEAQRNAGCLGTIVLAALTFIVIYNFLKLL